jgi:hypothetical protein
MIGGSSMGIIVIISVSLEFWERIVVDMPVEHMFVDVV